MTVVDSGQVISNLHDDFDNQGRPQASGIDIGADEFLTNSASSNPKNHSIDQ